MFSKILIANRGEIACRIIRTCQKMGVKTVAVYSEADLETPHVRMADEAVCIGPASPMKSYLNIKAAIEAAQKAGAEGIHPGYGFLSENSAFAIACRDAGIKFIGPSPEALQTMGDKIQVRQLAKQIGLPIIDGTNSAVSDKQALKRAKEIGYPLMVKAASGGGGIGMHIVRSPEQLKPIIEMGRNVAKSAFGSASLYFERYLEHASHIEVQVLADEKRHYVHMLERDCSVQRRNQKIIEVAPSVKLDANLRKEITGYAIKLAKHIKYTNAGTVEFMVSPEGDIYFLEMNKRLQVEHGITEMITGIDIVEMQLRIASGEALPFTRKGIEAHGFAMEARINAEDPVNFLPSAGRISRLNLPALSDKVRLDTYIYEGYQVGVHYDSLLGKLMCWGENREDARLRLAAALNELQIEGVQTNVPFLKKVVASEDFTSGKYDTWLVSTLLNAEKKAAEAAQEGRDKALAAAIAVAALSAREASRNGTWEAHGFSPSAWKTAGMMDQMAGRGPARRW
ncbi:MAG: ATP-grasp domain-containing protein [SAR202 cluster bacterium]|nr:ATP-grasp domain-containing protein [SAR202 cluster bacterium]